MSWIFAILMKGVRNILILNAIGTEDIRELNNELKVTNTVSKKSDVKNIWSARGYRSIIDYESVNKILLALRLMNNRVYSVYHLCTDDCLFITKTDG